VIFLEKVSGALEPVDSSSGAIGTAVNNWLGHRSDRRRTGGAVDGSLDLASRRMAPAATTLSLSVAMAGASITCLFGHSALLAQVLGASAFVIGVTAIFVEPARTVASIAVVATVSVLVYARLYAELSTLATALLVASPVAPSAASWLPLARRVRPIVAVITAVAFSITAALCARA